jgi:hypothetical protein
MVVLQPAEQTVSPEMRLLGRWTNNTAALLTRKENPKNYLAHSPRRPPYLRGFSLSIALFVDPLRASKIAEDACIRSNVSNG